VFDSTVLIKYPLLEALKGGNRLYIFHDIERMCPVNDMMSSMDQTGTNNPFPQYYTGNARP